MNKNNLNNIDIVNSIVFRSLHISNSSFENRLIAQKKIYILQILGTNLGFSYNWYVRGPYSPALTSYIYSNLEILSSFDSSSFKLTEAAQNNVNLVNEVADYRNELGLSAASTYELIASLLYIMQNKRAWGATDDESIIEHLLDYKPQFTQKQCETAISIIYQLHLSGQE